MNASSYSWQEFHENYPDIDRKSLTGIVYEIDLFKVIPIIAYAFLLVIGIAGNVWVACVIGCVLGERKNAPKCVQIYILALCCCDLVVLLFSIALLVDLVCGQWLIESTFLCRFYLSSESLNRFCAPFLLVALSHFCYVKVCKPDDLSSTYSIIGQKSRAVSGICHSHNGICMVIIFSIIISFALMTPVYIYGDLHYVVYENASGLLAVLTKCAFEPSEEALTVFTIYGFTLGYAMPASMFTCFHAAILFKVRKQAYENVGTRRRSHKYLMRVTRTIFGLVIFYVVCWTPYWCMFMYQALTPLDWQGEMTPTGAIFNYIVHMLPYINCTGYPVLYTLLNRDIRQAYDRVITRKQMAIDRELSTGRCSHRTGMALEISQKDIHAHASSL